MANSKIFCNIPWFELNINNDGSYDLCGCQNDKIENTPLGQVYNIKHIPIEEYWNSPRLQESRLRKLGNIPDPMCRMCQQKESVGYNSNRSKENSKSVIFYEQFDRSYQQSPHLHHFEYSKNNHGSTESHIHSLHVNIGDVCNFACRMCRPIASSRLQKEYKQLNWIEQDQKFLHWTNDPVSWNNFTKFLDKSADNIKVMHIIGGEVALIPKFKFLVDYFVDQGLANTVNLSFTINGSYTYEEYFKSLEQYKRTEIGISIESVSKMGDYIRQGGDIDSILKNIKWINQNKPSNMQLVLRTVPSLLSLSTYHELIEWALENNIPIDNSLLVNPMWQMARLLPDSIKQKVIKNVAKILKTLPEVDGNDFKNQKDPNKLAVSMRNECESIINAAKLPEPSDADEQRRICATKLAEWDKMKGISIKDYSRDLYDFLVEYGYDA